MSIDIISFAVFNSYSDSDQSVVIITDVSDDDAKVRAALKSLSPPDGEQGDPCQLLPTRDAIKKAQRIQIGDGAQRTFLPARKDDSAYAAQLRQTLDFEALPSDLRERIQKELASTDMPNGPTGRYRLPSSELPIGYLGRIPVEDALYLLSPRPVGPPDEPQSPWTLHNIGQTRTLELQALFSAESAWKIPLRPYELRQQLLWVDHDAPCVLEIVHKVLRGNEQPTQIDAFTFLVK